jgi:hypothetical protein
MAGLHVKWPVATAWNVGLAEAVQVRCGGPTTSVSIVLSP